MKGIIKTKPSWSPDVDESKCSTDEIKRQASKPKIYRGNKMQTKIQGLEIEANTNFKVQWSVSESYIFNLRPRASDKFTRKIKELERYLGATYSDNLQPAIMIETPETLPDSDMPTIIPDMGVKHLKTYLEITYLKKKKIKDAIS